MTKMSQRIASAAAALLLQAGFLLLLLQAVQLSPIRKELSREVTLTFLPLPAVWARPATQASPGIPSLVRPQVAPLTPPASSVIPAVPPGAIAGFGQALNDCAPENYENLSPDQKAHCVRPGQGVAVQEAPNLMGTPSEVKDQARWANALAHEKSPPWLPCTSVIAPEFGPGYRASAFDPACLVKEFADGKLTDPMSWPTYETQQFKTEDFYKIEQTYKDWHAEHAKAAAE